MRSDWLTVCYFNNPVQGESNFQNLRGKRERKKGGGVFKEGRERRKGSRVGFIVREQRRDKRD